MGMELVGNGYRTDTERERERVWNGNITRSVKRSLLGFFWSVLYLLFWAQQYFVLFSRKYANQIRSFEIQTH